MNPHVKIQFEINSQLTLGYVNSIALVNPHVKIQFEINSQHTDRILMYLGILVNPHVKIQFEINSQQSRVMLNSYSCESSRKNTI